MMAMAVSDLRIIAQVGTTIGLGLLFDTLIVRSFMTPSIAALMGRWFWWPQIVRTRPASALLQPVGPRPLVRSLLLKQPVPNGPTHGLAEHGYRRQVRVPDRLADASRRPPAVR
jgi:RND superfamily putative drug exporter